jgi:hypothetical protein
LAGPGQTATESPARREPRRIFGAAGTPLRTSPRIVSVRVALLAAGLSFSAPGRGSADGRAIPEARIESARGVALGTGTRAAAASTQAHAENPANLPLSSLYHMEAFLGYQPRLRRTGAGAAVVDSSTSRLAAGFSARGLFGDNDAGVNSGWEGRASLGMALGDMLAVGIAGRYANFTVSDPRARPERPVEVDAQPDQTFKLKAFSMDAAVTLHPLASFSVSLLGYNLIDTKSPLAPTLLGGSAAFGAQGLTVGGDLLVDMNRTQTFSGPKLLAGSGVEYLAEGVAPLRAGYMFDQGRHQHLLTGGIGYVDQRMGIQVSLRQSVAGTRETTIFTAVQYFMQQ